MADNRTFHKFEFKGIKFEGIMSMDGPYIMAASGRRRLGGVALGFTCVIREIDGEPWICKRGTQEQRVRLAGFEPQDVQLLANEFGLEAWEYGIEDEPDFFGTNAGRALADWVNTHPRIAATYAHLQSYMPRWHERSQDLVQNSAATISP